MRTRRSDDLPAFLLGKATPERICSNHSLDQLAPQHPIGDNAIPLSTDKLRGAEWFGIKIGENVFGNVFKAPTYERN